MSKNYEKEWTSRSPKAKEHISQIADALAGAVVKRLTLLRPKDVKEILHFNQLFAVTETFTAKIMVDEATLGGVIFRRKMIRTDGDGVSTVCYKIDGIERTTILKCTQECCAPCHLARVYTAMYDAYREHIQSIASATKPSKPNSPWAQGRG
jgi:hypothetical protein